MKEKIAKGLVYIFVRKVEFILLWFNGQKSSCHDAHFKLLRMIKSTNAGVSKSSTLSPTFFLILINNFLSAIRNLKLSFTNNRSSYELWGPRSKTSAFNETCMLEPLQSEVKIFSERGIRNDVKFNVLILLKFRAVWKLH